MNAPMERLLSQAEAAELLGCSVRYLQRLRKAGEGPRIIRLGARVKYRPRDIAAWIEVSTLGLGRSDAPVPNGDALARLT